MEVKCAPCADDLEIALLNIGFYMSLLGLYMSRLQAA